MSTVFFVLGGTSMFYSKDVHLSDFTILKKCKAPKICPKICCVNQALNMRNAAQSFDPYESSFPLFLKNQDRQGGSNLKWTKSQTFSQSQARLRTQAIMSARDVAAIGGVIVSIASAIREVGNGYYRSNAAWRALPEQIQELQMKLVIYREALEKYGWSDCPVVKDSMERAREVVAREKERLDSRLGGRSVKCFCVVAKEVAFPETVGASIRSATEACDRILANLRLRPEVEEVVINNALRAPMLLPFRRSSEYVPRNDTEVEILRLLNHHEPSYNVVLLHGAAGTGKSTLVREVSLQLQAPRDGSNSSLFSRVIWLECGPQVNVAGKHLEILECIGWNFSEMAQFYSQRDAFHHTKRQRLEIALQNQRLLIVLDDVKDLSLLRSLLQMSGGNPRAFKVKYLVTSLDKNLCWNLGNDYSVGSVEMEPLRPEDALKMLALNAGFSDGQIPSRFQNLATETLKQAQDIPLVIATLGAEIRSLGKEDESNWAIVSASLRQLLAEGTPEPPIHGTGYPQSYWISLKRGMDRLSTEQTQLFFLVAMCRGLSVPDAVIRIFYSVASSNANTNLAPRDILRSYLKSKNLLESLHYLKMQTSKSVSMHSLTRTFIVEEMGDDLKSISRTLAQDSDTEDFGMGSQVPKMLYDGSTLDALVCLYLETSFDPRLGKRAESCSSTSTERFSEVRRTTIEPIVQLLAHKMSLTRDFAGDWTEEHDLCSNEVFKAYVYENRLHKTGIQKLLCPTVSVDAISHFLAKVSLIKSFWPTIGDTIEGIPEALLGVLRDGTHGPDIHAHAAAAINLLSFSHRTSCSIVVNAPGMLDQLKETLASAQRGQSLEKTAAGYLIGILGTAAWVGDHDVRNKIADPAMLLPLADFLVDPQNPTLESVATLTFNALTKTTERGNTASEINRRLTDVMLSGNVGDSHNTAISLLIANTPQLIKKLAASLETSGNPFIQKGIMGTFTNLAKTQGAEFSERILKLPKLLDNVAKLLTQDGGDDSEIQSHAACLVNICTSTYASGVIKEVVNSETVVEGLTRSLLQYEKPILQMNAVCSICHLCQTRDPEILGKLLDSSGLLDALVQSTANDRNSPLQKDAGLALSRLALTGVASVKARLVNHERLLEALAGALRKGENPPLQNYTASCLAALAETEERPILQRIVECPGMLKNLTESLVDPQKDFFVLGLGPNPNNLRGYAAMTIAMLVARGGRELLEGLASFPALLDNLAGALLAPQGSVLQPPGTVALSALIPFAEQAFVDGIVDSSKLLEKLLMAVDKDRDPFLQEMALRVLHELFSSRTIREEIGGEMTVVVMSTLEKVKLRSNNPQMEAYLQNVILRCKDAPPSAPPRQIDAGTKQLLGLYVMGCQIGFRAYWEKLEGEVGGRSGGGNGGSGGSGEGNEGSNGGSGESSGETRD